MYIIIILLPLLGALISGLFGRKIGVTGSHLITTLFLLFASFLSSIAFYEIGISSSPVTIHLSQWIDSELLSISWEFLFDSLTVSMLIPVLYVSTLVHIYSISYMSEDPHNQRFFSYLSLFTFFMVVLVTGANYLIMFIGWEGIGVSSYLLINFWYTRIQANKAAILAFTMNRVGDMSLSIAFFSIFWVFGNLDYASIFALSPYINENLISIIGLLLLLAAMGKSAQIGLHGWLPGSMEGPTPVSALIHAATLVTAGVYLLMRSSPLIEYGSTALLVIMWVGSITAFFAASSGLLQNDLKRIIAFSTISQMGYLFMAVGLSQYNVALFHLVNHAFFKALLFLAAGSVIHAMHDQQDIRRLGGLITFLPFTYTSILIGSLSLMALPWLTGFYSKDLIIELAYAKYQFSGMASYYLGTLTAIFTAFYSFRLISLVFLTYPNASKLDYLHSHEASLSVIIPLSLLSLASIFFGFIFSDLFVGIGTDFFGNSLFIHPNHISLVEAEFSLPLIIKLLPTIGSVFAALLALYLYHSKSLSFKNSPLSKYSFGGEGLIELTDYSIGRKLYTFFNGKYLLDIIYNKYIIGQGLNIGYSIAKILDRGIYETVGPFGLSNYLVNTGKNISNLDNGKVTDYATYIAIAAIILPLGLLINITFVRIFILLLGSLILFIWFIPTQIRMNHLNLNFKKSILPLPFFLQIQEKGDNIFNYIHFGDILSFLEMKFNLTIVWIFNLYYDHFYLSMILFWIIIRIIYYFIHKKLIHLKSVNKIHPFTYKVLNFALFYIVYRLFLWVYFYSMIHSFIAMLSAKLIVLLSYSSLMHMDANLELFIKHLIEISSTIVFLIPTEMHMYSEDPSSTVGVDSHDNYPNKDPNIKNLDTLFMEGSSNDNDNSNNNSTAIPSTSGEEGNNNSTAIPSISGEEGNNNSTANSTSNSNNSNQDQSTTLPGTGYYSPTVKECTEILNSFVKNAPSSSNAGNNQWTAVEFDPMDHRDTKAIHILKGKDRRMALRALTGAESELFGESVPSLEHYGQLLEPRLVTNDKGKHVFQLWVTEFAHNRELDANFILDVVKFTRNVKNQDGLINGIIERENVTPQEIKGALKKFMTVTPQAQFYKEKFHDVDFQAKVKYFYDKKVTVTWTLKKYPVNHGGTLEVMDIQINRNLEPVNDNNNTISKRVRRKPK